MALGIQALVVLIAAVWMTESRRIDVFTDIKFLVDSGYLCWESAVQCLLPPFAQISRPAYLSGYSLLSPLQVPVWGPSVCDQILTRHLWSCCTDYAQ